ncbi:MAG TPA: dihydroorotate dehydrogenase electron transfer subunit [Thermoplasmatales archaeon]|nr:dihydroorotate dehydrogenase electron transfer subunit [Thermoplasmatales archaeon]
MYPRFVKVREIEKETPDIKTIKFNFPENVEPGQFFMVMVYGVDEIPMSASIIEEDIKGITFRKVGEATEALHMLEKGDLIGVRGPIGNGFRIEGREILFVAGGTGIASIAPAVERAYAMKKRTTVVLGARTKEELFFVERLKKSSHSLYLTTDDGSTGYKGFASDLGKKLIERESFDQVITCGPEIMMKKIFDECIKRKIEFQASLERYMKCGMGLCGQCCIGEGLRVCIDGPVFDGETLKKCHDFGVYSRDAAGRRVYFQ